MFKKTRFAVALVVALAAMGVAASSAFAISATVANGGAVNATGSATFEGGGISIVCPLTLENSLLTGPIAIARGAKIGETTGVRIGSCTGGSVESVLALPWNLTIHDSLPTIASLTTRNATGLLLDINGASFNLSVFGGFVNCLYSGTAGALLTLTHTARESVTYTGSSLRALEAVSLPLIRGGFGCPSSGHFAGTFTLSAFRPSRSAKTNRTSIAVRAGRHGAPLSL
jgi:hypothetical protein